MATVRKAVLSGLAVGTVLSVGVAVAAPAISSDQTSATRVAVSAVADEPITSTITGTYTGRNDRSGTVTGTFTPKKFGHNGQSLTVRGVLNMVLTDAEGNVFREISRTVVAPVTRQAPAPAAGTSSGGLSVTPAAFAPAAIPVPEGCDILNLVLGPLDLNLLGLVIVLQQVQLDIVAVPGAGALLGNLLCAVAGLLDGGFDLGIIADVLNAVLAVIEALGGAAGAANQVTPTAA
jgi:hypothetical protein